MTPRRERLLLDEMVPPVLAELLSDRGIDALAVAAAPALVSATDYELVEHAFALERTIVTMDVRDFHRLHTTRVATGLPMPPLIFINPARFPLSRRAIPRLAAALVATVEAGGASGFGGIRWLAPVK